jgi:hypothetical protein
MPREKFIDATFTGDAKILLDASVYVIAEYAKQGFDLTLRQLYYQLVSRGVIPNHDKFYTKLGDVITRGRLAGEVDWDAIQDRNRQTLRQVAYANPGTFVTKMADQFHTNVWKDQDNHVEVMVEKQALEGVLWPVAAKLGVALTSNKGYSSSTSLYDCSKRLLAAIERGKHPVMLYFGDHDPSGIDMTRDVKDRLTLMCRREVEVVRVALNIDQVRAWNLLPQPAKVQDARAADYIRKFGDKSWELDAVSPARLVQMLKEAILAQADFDVLKEALLRQEELRQRIVEMGEEYQPGKRAGRKPAKPAQTNVVKDDDDVT